MDIWQELSKQTSLKTFLNEGAADELYEIDNMEDLLSLAFKR